ncbi:guanylin-like [Spea bombifrons]|uniref:guanylin-like n=1 Tax=Spea bombifrons TaxID=233779 RepID=UPI00234B8CA8|nr:guanylin-like [Spea bombifrons]
MWPRALCLLLLLHFCSCVIVKDGDFSFPLESVKKLSELLGSRIKRDISEPEVLKLCTDPRLPEEILPVCASPNAAEVLYRLGQIALNPDVCEVCAFAACTGC